MHKQMLKHNEKLRGFLEEWKGDFSRHQQFSTDDGYYKELRWIMNREIRIGRNTRKGDEGENYFLSQE